MFHAIDVRALRRPVVNQRLDLLSTNSYSILPALTKIGVLDYSNTALFHQRPIHFPVFAFGAPGSGLSSLAMALSMLGYRCCSDLDRIPECELEKLTAGRRAQTIFDAYVNVDSLRPYLRALTLRYPHAKFFMTADLGATGQCIQDKLEALEGADVVYLLGKDANTWRQLCEHLKLPPPAAPYPAIREVGQRKLRSVLVDKSMNRPATRLRYDRSPWVAEPHADWVGISVGASDQLEPFTSRIIFEDDMTDVQSTRWLLRNDTFPGNLGLFRPANVCPESGGGLSLAVRQETLGVRRFSAGAISSRHSFPVRTV